MNNYHLQGLFTVVMHSI